MRETVEALRKYDAQVRVLTLRSGYSEGWCYLDIDMRSVVAFYYCKR